MAETMITTVIPTFRRPMLLKRAIESVLAQSFKGLKVCVYDNASGDETEAIVRAFAERDSRVFYYKNSKNIGAVANVIQGFNAVTTNFYSLLSDDDFLLPDFYENAVKAFENNKNVGLVCSKTIVIDLINAKLQFRNQDWASGVYEPSNEIVSKMYSSHFVTTGVLLSRNVREAIGVFDSSGSDSLYMAMAAATVPFVVLDHYGAAVTLHEHAYSMIGEGIAKEDVLTLYKHLLTSIENVMKIEMPPERKVHLLMLVINSYHQIFDSKKLNYLLGKQNEDQISNLSLLPSLITNRGLVAKIYNLAPMRLRPIVKFVYEAINLNRRKRETQNWSTLPEDAHVMLSNLDTNITKINSFLRKANKLIHIND